MDKDLLTGSFPSKPWTEDSQELVGARGFEPPTTCTPCKYATRLRYAPTKERIISSGQYFQNSREFRFQVKGSVSIGLLISSFIQTDSGATDCETLLV